MSAHRIYVGCKHGERGATIVQVAISLTVLCGMAALGVDVGWMYLTRTELQAAADSAALAAASQLQDEDIVTGTPDLTDDIVAARDSAESFAALNTAARSSLLVDRNEANYADGGVVAGYLDNPADFSESLDTSDPQNFNSVSVVCERSQSLNGPVSTFFARVLGTDEVSMEARATATLDDRIVGFELLPGQNLPMLPFAIADCAWYEQTDGSGDSDSYGVEDGVVSSSQSDGIPEVTVYPYKYNLCIPDVRGNVGTVFVSDVVGTSYVQSQIYSGMNQADLDFVGGLELADDGSGDLTQWLPGENWMSSSWHTALLNIKGQTRIVPLYRSVIPASQMACANPLDEVFSGLRGELIGPMPETCCAITNYYEVTEYKAVTVVDSTWSYQTYKINFVVQPTQITTPLAKTNPAMEGSGLIYKLSLTR